MSDEFVTCPDCGYQNPTGSTSCWRCNFPLLNVTPGAAAPTTAAPDVLRPTRPIRPRRPRAQQPMQTQLWLFFGAITALAVIFTAVKGFHQSNFQPVAGAQPEQQKIVDDMRGRLERDSLDVQARIMLADVLYDTANWNEAIHHYEIAARLDPGRAATYVDMGVCWFNLGEAGRAEELFQFALQKQPNLTQALFNLGIVNEQRQEFAKALDFYHRAIESNPPATMQQALNDALARVSQKSGAAAPGTPNAK